VQDGPELLIMECSLPVKQDVDQTGPERTVKELVKESFDLGQIDVRSHQHIQPLLPKTASIVKMIKAPATLFQF
jgi:hypothetical protein